jgi:hypothetical protein
MFSRIARWNEGSLLYIDKCISQTLKFQDDLRNPHKLVQVLSPFCCRDFQRYFGGTDRDPITIVQDIGCPAKHDTVTCFEAQQHVVIPATSGY